MFRKTYDVVFEGDAEWRALPVPSGATYAWDARSTYIKHPPYFEGMPPTPGAVTEITGARVLALLGDSITTDHISPAGSIKKDGPAGRYLIGLGVDPKDFNSYGARRGNHEVMVRGTFANTRPPPPPHPGGEGPRPLPHPPPQEPAGPRHRGGRHPPPPRRPGDVDLRRGHAVRGREGPPHRAGRQGVRQRLVSRLGSQGDQ